MMKSLTYCEWIMLRSAQWATVIDTDQFNLISNPDKFDEADPDLMLIATPMSNCYSISQINKSVKNGAKGDFSVSLKYSIRSLQKNVTLLEDFLYPLDKRPELLALTETRLNTDSTVYVW